MQLPTCETKFAVENPGCGPKQPPPARNSSGAARGSGNAGAGRLRACLHSWSGSSPALRPLRSAAPGSAFPVPLAQRRPGGGRRAAAGSPLPPPRPLPPAPSPPPSGFLDRCTGGREGGSGRRRGAAPSSCLPREAPVPTGFQNPDTRNFHPGELPAARKAAASSPARLPGQAHARGPGARRPPAPTALARPPGGSRRPGPEPRPLLFWRPAAPRRGNSSRCRAPARTFPARGRLPAARPGSPPARCTRGALPARPIVRAPPRRDPCPGTERGRPPNLPRLHGAERHAGSSPQVPHSSPGGFLNRCFFFFLFPPFALLSPAPFFLSLPPPPLFPLPTDSEKELNVSG